MKLHNTLSRSTEDFNPLEDNTVRMYTCGPTVYNHVHIGNLASFIYADTLRRVLTAAGNKVQHVMNFTDVDDKTIRRSAKEYPDETPEEALKKLTREYEEIFLIDTSAVGNDVAAIEYVRATASIDKMQALIKELYDKDFAYIADDGVYFSIEKYKASGKKYGQLLEITSESTSSARIQNDEYDKDYVHDFALWKTRRGEEPAWDFELDGHNLLGRPGWHIECSAMSTGALGMPFDIHTGGIDLIFPHHENEIAQSIAGHDDSLYARYFVHSGHLQVDGKKMSKSLDNFVTLRDIQERGFEPLAFRLLVLQSRYYKQSNFTWEALEAAQNRLKDIYAWADLRHQPSAKEMSPELDSLFRETRESILEALEDNLNTPAALAALGKLVNYMQNIPIPGVEGEYTDGTLAFLDAVLGLGISDRPDITDDQKKLLADRQKARETNDWGTADTIRDQLKEQGLGIRDMDFGQQWFRI